MKVIDVFYSESKNISCISVRYRGIKAGQKITDENGNLYSTDDWLVLPTANQIEWNLAHKRFTGEV